jgi:hypothetical protein
MVIARPQVASERRLHGRTPLDVPALIDGMSFWRCTRVIDVSIGGVSLEIEAPLPLGHEIDVYFELPLGVAIETRAVVVRQHGPQVGLRFLALDERGRDALTTFCSELRVQRTSEVVVRWRETGERSNPGAAD